MKSRPAPAPVFISDPSKYMVQSSGWIGAVGSWVSTHSAMKSAKTWDLMAFRGANEIVSPMISTAHFAILPEASRHWMISPRGKDDTTVTR
jgi:ABC-type taurine transport system substrate-binding protein